MSIRYLPSMVTYLQAFAFAQKIAVRINATVTIILVLVPFQALAIPATTEELPRPRVIISTDIGGTDPDDFQSMVHLLLYADALDIEGLISSPFGAGRKHDIVSIIDMYERDLPALSAHSTGYPSARKLRSITKQGETQIAPYHGYRRPTEGSQWLIQRALVEDPRPLHVLVWGGIEDLAQALHDAPEILPKLRVYYIGGPNKKWSPNAYAYIANEHPKLWIIETNASYRGWFEGGNQTGNWDNTRFVTQFIDGRGALGTYFATLLGGSIKMGDSPSVAWALSENSLTPSTPCWGGQFVRSWARAHKTFYGLTTQRDTVDEFDIVEIALDLNTLQNKEKQSGKGKKNILDNTKAFANMHIENQTLTGFIDNGQVHFRFSPKAARKFSYLIESNIASIHGKKGELIALPTSAQASAAVDPLRTNWWTDNPAAQFAEGPHIGAKTVSRWREDFLADFAERMQRAQAENAAPLLLPTDTRTKCTHKE